MADSWEDNDFQPPPIFDPKKQTEVDTKRWEDEDKPEVVKESWDEDDKPKKTAAPAKKVPGKAAKNSKAPRPVIEERLIDKMEQQRLVEESDFKNTQEIFSGLKEDNIIDIKNPKDEKDFDALADTLSSKLSAFDKSPHYRNFVKNFTKKLTQNLQVEDVKEIYTALTVVYNERLKADKEKTKKKKGAPVIKKNLNMKDDDFDEGDYDEYSDFM